MSSHLKRSCENKAWKTGFEPMTFAIPVQCSNQPYQANEKLVKSMGENKARKKFRLKRDSAILLQRSHQLIS